MTGVLRRFLRNRGARGLFQQWGCAKLQVEKHGQRRNQQAEYADSPAATALGLRLSFGAGFRVIE